jgi:hypothetical protein
VIGGCVVDDEVDEVDEEPDVEDDVDDGVCAATLADARAARPTRAATGRIIMARAPFENRIWLANGVNASLMGGISRAGQIQRCSLAGLSTLRIKQL